MGRAGLHSLGAGTRVLSLFLLLFLLFLLFAILQSNMFSYCNNVAWNLIPNTHAQLSLAAHQYEMNKLKVFEIFFNFFIKLIS